MLAQFPAVALLGPRQVGKTTLARSIAAGRPSVYLDLEKPSDLNRLANPDRYLSEHEDRLVVLDEVHQMPDLFRMLRGIIDIGIEKGLEAGRFLLLGSASAELLRQMNQSLAGRIAYLELNPLDVLEIGPEPMGRLWARGGFPNSFLAKDDEESLTWRDQFIGTFLSRDIPSMGPRIPMRTLSRFWTELAFNQGSEFNAARAARSLAVDGKTTARYLDIFDDLMMVRRLPPLHVNVSKRLRKSPKVYIRDSGLLHALLRILNYEMLTFPPHGHPQAGASWEGFVIENLLSAAPERTEEAFYRTAAGAEIDLVLDFPGRAQRWAIDIQTGRHPKPSKGFYNAIEDVKPDRAFVVCGGQGHYPMSDKVEAIDLPGLMRMLAHSRIGAGPVPQ